MRSRNHPFTFYMNEKELTHFEKQVKLSGLTKADFLRGLIKKVEIKSRLPDDYFKVYRLVSNLANNINQIARHANSTGYIDPKQMDAAVLLIEKCWKHVKELR